MNFTVRLLDLTRPGIHLLQSVLAILLILSFSFSGVIRAREYEAKEMVRTKEISGEVSVIRPRYISIIYERDEKKGAEYEMMFPINEDVKFTRKGLDEIKVGDQVSITYGECSRIEENEETGKEEERFIRRDTKGVEFIRPALKGKLISR